jgi:hypothetical protein
MMIFMPHHTDFLDTWKVYNSKGSSRYSSFETGSNFDVVKIKINYLIIN